MNRKNIFVLSAVMFLLVFSMACQSTSRTAVSASDEIVSLMAEMAASREYAALYHLPAAYDETVGAICDGDYSTPSAVYSLDIPENQLPGIDIDDLSVSDGMQAYLRSAAYISFASSICLNISSSVSAPVVARKDVTPSLGKCFCISCIDFFDFSNQKEPVPQPCIWLSIKPGIIFKLL